jgi:glycosyltransferase involved in cell wall biosynthesis
MSLAVLISSYNHEEYVSSCLESALSLKDVEIFCSDDGSSDASPLVLKHYSNLYENVNFFEGEQFNIGFAPRINFLLEKVDSDYIQILNSDDLMNETVVSSVLSHVRNYDLDFAFGGIGFVDEDNKSQGYLNGPFEPQITFPKAISDNVQVNCTIPNPQVLSFLPSLIMQNWVRSSSNIVASRGALEKTQGVPNYFYASDWALALELVANFKGYFVNKPMINYRVHSRNTINQSINQSASEVQEIIGNFLARYPEYREMDLIKLGHAANPYLCK